MSFSFRHERGLIRIDAAILGLNTDALVQLYLDTGAERTVISSELMTEIGFEPEQVNEPHELITGSGKTLAPLLVLPKIYALGKLKENFPVFCHTLPTIADIDGVLGLDFLRSHVFKIDFINGQITLE